MRKIILLAMVLLFSVGVIAQLTGNSDKSSVSAPIMGLEKNQPCITAYPCDKTPVPEPAPRISPGRGSGETMTIPTCGEPIDKGTYLLWVYTPRSDCWEGIVQANPYKNFDNTNLIKVVQQKPRKV